MNFIIEHFAQLGIGLVLGIALFIGAYVAPPRIVVAILLLLIPFQPVETRYGSLNMVLSYMLFFAFLLKGRISEWPFIWIVIGIIFVYLMSISQALPITYMAHSFYVLTIGGNFALFYLVYNFFRQDADVRFAMNVFVGICVLALCHFAFSSFIGFEKFALFGIEELDLMENREIGRRLIGPFNGAEFSSDFLAFQIILLGYIMLFQNKLWKQLLLAMLAMACFGFMLATGSRGGFIALIPGGFLFFIMFREHLGVKGFFKAGVVIGMFALSAIIIVAFSEFNVIFERLKETHLVGFELDTRAGIVDMVMERISERPILGHGPRLFIPDAHIFMRLGYEPLGFNPHSLYLFLLFTIGALGFIMYMVFFFALIIRWWSCRRQKDKDPMIECMPRFALLIMLMFLLTEYRIEFLRFAMNDYQQYMFALWAAMLAFTGIIKNQLVPNAGVQSELPQIDNRTDRMTILHRKDGSTI